MFCFLSIKDMTGKHITPSSCLKSRYNASLAISAIVSLKGTSPKDKSGETMTLILWIWMACYEEKEEGEEKL